MTPSPEQAVAETRAWVERAVIGLNLCPFAKAVQTKGLVRYVASGATDAETLLTELCDEMRLLVDTPASEIDTTLLIHPNVLTDFVDYNDYLELVDAALEEMGLTGVLQVASFHPDYQFDGTEASDVTNATNQSPYPTLHLLREDSVDRAVAAFAEPDAIFEMNMQTLENLGEEGWATLKARCRKDASVG